MTSEKAPVRLVMVDDHVVVREGLRSLLELSGKLSVVATVSSAEELLASLDKTPCDIVLVDIELPDGDGVWCTRRIKELRPGLPVVVLTMHTDERIVVDAVQAGADGYIIKSASADELIHALLEVHGGRSYIDPRVAGSLLTSFRRRRLEPHGELLSAREREILVLAATGLNNKDIAQRLTLTQNTIKTHLRAIYRKCDVPDRVHAVLYAIRKGLVDADAAATRKG